ncbi:MAG: sigma-70 family RNA polymerase sigma factor [Acidaminococcaceae bacterium]|nr:sigma-70 family RNA polymerase sigma factor [Acidaminococcaceae bacterium]
MNLQTFTNSDEANCNTQQTEKMPVSDSSSCLSDNIPDSAPATPLWGELICRSQNGDCEATLNLLRHFEALLDHEARCMVRQGIFTEFQDAKSETVLLFLEFIARFRQLVKNDATIPGLFKRYLHNERIELAEKAQRHCPDGYSVDFEKELAENSPFSQLFPRYEMQEDESLYRKFRSLALREALKTLNEREIFIVKKHYLENKPPSQIAKELHCSTRYVRKIKQTALEKLRRYLEDRYPSFRAL